MENFVVGVLAGGCIDYLNRSAIGAELDDAFGYSPGGEPSKAEIAVHEFLDSAVEREDLYGEGPFDS